MTKTKYVTDLLTIEEVVSGKLFKIPDYQRGYSWDNEQVEDLLTDIEHISHQDHKHYTGTLVISKDATSERYNIVDGQQRLTTLIILLKELYEIDKEKYSHIHNTFLIQKKGQYILETNKETDAFFKECIIGDKKNIPATIKSLQNLRKSKTQIYKWLRLQNGSIDVIHDTVLNKLGFLCFAPANIKEIGIMFEVINNRGKALSELEKIKNYFIYYATINNKVSLQVKVNNNWESILKYLSESGVISNQDENNFLRNCYLVYYSANKSKSWNVYDELKLKYKPDDKSDLEDKIEEIEGFIDFIQEASQSFAYFTNGDVFIREYEGPLKKEIATVLKQLRCHPVNASVLPMYLATMSYLQDKPETVLELLKIIEITNFRIYVLPNANISRADSKQGDLFFWANELFNCEDWHSDNDDEKYETYLGSEIHGDIFDCTKAQLIDFTKRMCPESVFVQSLTVDLDESIDYYHWNGLRFFLASYEEELNVNRKITWDIEKILISRQQTKKEKLNDYLSREHIWANKNLLQYFPENYIDKRRLGNFVLIGLSSNIQINAWNIENKVKFLIDNSSSPMMQVNELKKKLDKAWTFACSKNRVKKKNFYRNLGCSLIDQRENELIKFALKRWKFEDEKFNRFIEIDTFKAVSQNKNETFFLKEK
ncbi:DUF262 domain-containing protein [Algibacter aquimarinus]|uniref:GmrSD restriction endonucleases N-terminal domain-containing protein n=1 Tax=Algibacter aquimarinus TaxID=1136748 RepID=A0ABP9HI52_9FLAO